MTILDCLTRNARQWPEDVALIERNTAVGSRRELSWGEFDRLANRIAHALRRRGVKRGDRVQLLLTNCLEWLPLYFGVLRAGAWAVPLNFRFTEQELGRCAAGCEARWIIYGAEFGERVARARDHGAAWEVQRSLSGTGGADWTAFLAEGKDSAPGIPCRGADTAALYFTSGTTGRPKPILLTHANLAAACRVEAAHHGQTRDDTFILIPPLYHTGAKMHWFGSLFTGGRAVILRGAGPRHILDAVSQEYGTIVWLLVPWAQDILDALERGELHRKDFRLDQWRLTHIGAQPVPPSLVHRWLETFPGQQYDTNYGLSEASGPGCVHLGTENTHKVGAIGLPGHGWKARVVDAAGAEVAAGEVGELAVQGPGVMREYYSNPEATAAVLRDGWLYTGDMARRDTDGFLYLVDRKKDVIIVGGENVYPVEVEEFLQAHPRVRDAAVIGCPDPRLGERVVAVVEPRPGEVLTGAELLAYCEALPRYKRPRQVHLAAVPRNATGKIEKPRLRACYGAGPT